MTSNAKNPGERIFLCHKQGMCPVLRVDGEGFLLEDDRQTIPGTVRLDAAQARSLLEALRKLLPQTNE